MVEFVEGSGFYPPTLNSFQGNISFDENIGNETKVYSVTNTDRVELSSLSFFHAQTNSTSSGGSYTATLKIGPNIITEYTYSATSTGNATYLDTLIQNTTIVLEKNDILSMTITGTGLAGGQGTQKGSITIFGKYTI